MQTSLDAAPYRASANVERVVLNVKECLRTVTGVENATATCCVPLQDGFNLRFVIASRPFDGSAHGSSGWRPTSAGYFEVFRIRLLRGRAFTDRDDAAAPPVAVIDETMARQLWPGSDPLNDQLIIGRRFVRQFANDPERQIIGVVADTRDVGMNSVPSPMVFVPQAQLPDDVNTLSLSIQPVTWVVRTSVEPMTIARTVQEQIGQVTSSPVSDVRSMDSIVAHPRHSNVSTCG